MDFELESDQPSLMCIVSIMTTYFSQLSPVFISLDLHQNYSGLQDDQFMDVKTRSKLLSSVLTSLYSSEKWSIYLFNFTNETEMGLFGRGYAEKPASYFIFVDFPDILRFEENIRNLRSLPVWNPWGMFLVYVNDIDINEEDILKCFWKYRILEVVILKKLKDSNTLEKFLHLNHFKKAETILKNLPTLGVYRWSPFQDPPKCCDSVVFVDVWIAEGRGRFLLNRPLFGHKSQLNYHKCPLTISTYPNHRVVLPYKQIDGHVVFDSGWEILLIQIISQYLNSSIYFVPYPPDLRLYIMYENGTEINIFKDLEEYKTDVVFAGLPIIQATLDVSDPTVSYTKMRYGWLVPCSKPLPHWQGMLRIFTSSLWAAYIGCMVLSAIFITAVSIFKKRYLMLQKGTYHKFCNSACSLYSICLGAVMAPLPKSATLRVFFFVWLCYCFAFNTVVQTFLMSFLVEPYKDKQISSWDEMLSSRIEFGYESVYDGYFKSVDSSMSRYLLEKRHKCPCITCCLKRLAFKRDFAVFYNLVRYKYSVKYEYLSNETGEALICSIAEGFYTSDVAMFVAKGHFVLNRMNDIIKRIVEAGIYEKIENDDEYWEERRIFREKQNYFENSSFVKISLHHIEAAIFLLLVGNLLSLIALLLEFSLYHLKKY